MVNETVSNSFIVRIIYFLLSTLSVLAHEDEHIFSLYNKTFSAISNRKSGYSEMIVGSGGVIGLQRTAQDDKHYLQLYEITNGSMMVQMIFSPKDVLSNCDVINTHHEIHKLGKHITSKSHKRGRFNNFSMDTPELERITDIDYWMEKCNSLHANELDVAPQPTRPTLESQPQRITTHLRKFFLRNKVSRRHSSQTQSHDRSKRGITDLIYPGNMLRVICIRMC